MSLPGSPARRRDRRLRPFAGWPGDLAVMAGCASAFSFSLGAASVGLPLLALHAGYSGAAIGVLTALSAAAQLGTRAMLGYALSRYPDRMLVVAAALLIAVSSALVVFSDRLVPFAIAELVQGAARGCFWTGTQAHVVRRASSAVRALGKVNLISSMGLLTGPAAAGVLAAHDRREPLALAAAVGLLAAGVAVTLESHPPFRPPRRARKERVWRRPAVAASCWAGVAAGAWRGLLGSFVPVVLTAAGQSTALVGGLVSVANTASMLGAGTAGRLPPAVLARMLVVGTVGAGLGTTGVALGAGVPVLAGAALVLSGLGAGALQTLGPALAADAVDPEERGLAIAATGTFRAGSLLLAPLATSAMVLLVPVVPALSAAGLLTVLPVLAPVLARRRDAR